MRDDLVARAAREGHPGWWDPGVALFHEVGDRLGQSDRRPCGSFERLVLVERALAEAGAFFAALRRPDAFVDAADRLFGELAAEGVTPSELEAGLGPGAARDGFQRERDRALTSAYRFYTEALEAEGRRDGRDTVADAARQMVSDPAACAAALNGRTRVRLVGLQDLAGGWPRLLSALPMVPRVERVEVQSAVRLDLPREDIHVVSAPLANALCARLLGPDAAPTDAPARETFPRLVAFSAHGADRETEEVAARVRALLDAGVPPAEVCVVARSGRPYTDLALRALDSVGVPATARRRRRLEQIPVVRAVLSLFSAAAQGWTRHGLAELAEQPYVGSGLDAVVINHIGFHRRVAGLSAWSSAIRRLLEQAELSERESTEEGDGTRRPSRLPPAEWVRRTLHGFESFAESARLLDRPRTRGEWLEWLGAALDADTWGVSRLLYRLPGGREELARWDVAGWEGMRRIVDELRAGEDSWGSDDALLDVTSFARFLRSMLKGDAAIWTTVRTGVRVLEAPAAAYRRFAHVFVVGMESGRWPLLAPASPLLEEGDRERLRAAGLPLRTRTHWERRERDLFGVVVGAAAQSLTLSWSRVDDRGEGTIASGFLEDLESVAGSFPVEAIPTRRVLTPGVPLFEGAAGARQAEYAARMEEERAAGRPGPWNGLVEDPELVAWLTSQYGDSYVWSPTSLEGMAKCPWAWYSARLLRLEKREDPDADLEPIARGNLFHDALHRFYDRARERVDAPFRLMPADLDWARPAVGEALRRAIEEATPRDAAALRAVPPALRDAKTTELERALVRYLEWEAELAAQGENKRAYTKYPQLRTGVVEHELAFEDLEVAAGSGSLRIRGKIDRVEVGTDPRVRDVHTFLAAVDYKSSDWSVPARGKRQGWDDGVVLQIPLYAAALEQLRPGQEIARLEYRTISNRNVKHQLPLVTVAKGDEELVRDPAQASRRERALEAAARQAAEVRAGRFPARPAPSCGCPPYCQGWDICRVPGGPKR
ncbi:MAG: PD-(D/E)XK nuclease family protein [Gemmatimonadota bacterium]